jgi:ketosteroid isomerase-like protein
MTHRETVLSFVEAVNAHSPARIAALLTDGHLFVDAHDQVYQGKEIMRDSWNMFFQKFPDYRIEVNELFEQGDTFILVGHASGTLAAEGQMDPAKHWRRPAAWKVKVSNDLIQHWQVFVDTKPMYDVSN